MERNIFNISGNSDFNTYEAELKKEMRKKFGADAVDNAIWVYADGFELGRKYPDERTIKRILALQYLWTNAEHTDKSLIDYIEDGLLEEHHQSVI